MIRLYLHLGYPKTGTTTLQRAFFDPLYRAGCIQYLGMFGFERDATPARKSFFTGLTKALYLEEERDFAATLPGLRESFWRLCDGVDGPVLLSNEHFVQSQWSTSVPGQRIFPARTAARLAQVFEGVDVSLMLAVRRQDTLLRSMFLENVSRPNHANSRPYRNLSDYLALCLDPADFHSAFYDFDGVLNAYQNAFPHAPMLTWTFEAFRDRQVNVLGKISAFLGLGDSVPSCISVPLPQKNAKSNSGAPVEMPGWSLFHKVVYSMPGGKALAKITQRSPLMKAMSSALKPRVFIQAMPPHEAEAIMRNWAESNSRLAATAPNLAKDLKVGGYVSS